MASAASTLDKVRASMARMYWGIYGWNGMGGDGGVVRQKATADVNVDYAYFLLSSPHFDVSTSLA